MSGGYYSKVMDAVEVWNEVNDSLKEIRDTVCATMGPGAGYVAISQGAIGGRTLVVKDGVTVSTFLKYKDQLKQAVSSIVNDAAKTTVRIAGDGTTTATLLTAELALSVRKVIEQMKNNGEAVIVRDISSDLKLLLSKVIGHLDEMVWDVTKQEELYKVALIACNSNEELAKIVSDAVWRVGKDGRVFIETSADEKTKMIYEDGYVFGHKNTPTCFDDNFIMDKSKGETVLLNPYIFIADEEFDSFDSIEPILKAYMAKKEIDLHETGEVRPLLMIVSDCYGPARATLLQNFKKAPIFVIKAPDFNERRAALLGDIAWLTNTPRVFSNLKGNVLETFGDDYQKSAANGRMRDERWREFGEAKQVIFGKNMCIIKHLKSQDEINATVEKLHSAIDNSNSPEDRDFYIERISKLVGGIATIYVGGYSDTETTNSKLFVDDAIRSCFCAIREGVLPGAGVALKEVRHKLSDYVSSLKYPVLLRCFEEVLLAPYRTIRQNLEVECKYEDIEEGFDMMVNPINDSKCNALEAGIIDPVLVTKTAIMAAVSAANELILTRKYIINENAQNN